MEKVKERITHYSLYVTALLKWLAVGALVGGVGGFVGALFHLGVDCATNVRLAHPWILYLLPLGGVVIALLYRLCRLEGAGTNAVIESVHFGSDVPVLLVGHVTKDGSIAGPRTLEHLVDVVCQFEGDSATALRLLRAVKNRFGPTDEVGCFDMSGEGIEEVIDPSGLFLSSNGDAGSTPVEGTCVTFTLDGHRSLPIEVQALVTDSVLPTPRRAVNGVDNSRIAMLTAVLYRHGKLNLLGNDLYVSTIAGGIAKEPGCDLSIVAALASAAKHTPIARTTCAIGEISLTGQVRPVPRLEYRLREAARLGFTTAVTPVLRKRVSVAGLNIIQVDSLRDALESLGLAGR